MLFAEVAATSSEVASTSSRTAKRDAIAALLARLEADEVEPVVGFLIGVVRQGRIGVGWRSIVNAEQPPAAEPSLSVLDVDRAVSDLQVLSGPGSVLERRALLGSLLGAATADEARFLTFLLGGELRQGASEGVMLDAVAAAWSVPTAVVRRAVMLGGRIDTVARLAAEGGADAVRSVGLELGRPLQPMLASTAASVTEAVGATKGPASVEWKLDGIRIQVHRRADRVRVWTRNLNDITERLPGVVEAVLGLPVDSVVLDGEALSVGADGRPRMFQDTMGDAALRPFFFDVMHLDDEDLIDRPLGERLDALDRIAGPWRLPATSTDDPEVGESVLADALAAGHEGAVVKSLASSYEAGRRGKAWRKVKPVHTFDLVVLGAEWGHGRRSGWLSNLHLGARTDDGSFVMVGKTFKGLTDELLRWQTARFLELAAPGASTEPPPPGLEGMVEVRPEQVVEIAIDGVQRSTRYPGGVALRFARVVRYRDDKSADQADLLAALQAMLGG